MAHTTGNTSTDDVFATWISRKFISDLEWVLQHQKFTTKATMPEGYGANTARFVEFAPPLSTGYASGSTAMTEATTTEHEITAITTTGTNVVVAEYGEFLKIGKLYEYSAVSGTRDRLAKRLKDGGLVAIDTVVRTEAVKSTNILYASLGATGGQTALIAPSGMGATTIIQARKILLQGLATGFDNIKGHHDGDYAVVISTKQELDIVTEITTSRVYWTNCVVNVPGALGQEKFVRGYIGGIYGTSVYVTQNSVTAAISGTTSDIAIAYADGGVAAVSFGDMDPKVIINDVNSPYKNVNSIAWHAYFGAGIVGGAGASPRIVKIYSAS